ncbi:MAG: thiamine-phosphate kinase, partial [Flavobacteriales bacterium]
MENTRTELSELGEFGLIDHLAKGIELHQGSSLLGIGDDAAVIDTNGQALVMSTDMLCEGVHFNLMYTPLKHLGYKAIVVNLSDIYAMNATPTQVVVALGMSNRFSAEAVNELYDGIKLACAKYDVDLVGGDISTSQAGLVLSVTATGLVNESEVVKRSGGKKGDLLILSGDTGGAYFGLQILEREKEVFEAAPTAQPELEGVEYLLERQLKPEARRDVVELLAQLEVLPTAMIDVSDGLSSELMHICK